MEFKCVCVCCRLWDVNNGEVLRRAEGRAAADEVCGEIATLAARLVRAGPAPRQADLVEFVRQCAADNAANFSSMCMDVRAGRRTEIEQLCGWIEMRAQQLGTPHAANARLAASIRSLHPPPVG